MSKDKTSDIPGKDLNVLELGYLTRDAEAVMRVKGEPAYFITLKDHGEKSKPIFSQNKTNLIVIPGEEKHIVLLLKSGDVARLTDMDDTELRIFVQSYKS